MFCIKTQFVIVLYYVTYCAIYFCVEIDLLELNSIHIVVYLTMASHTLSCDFEDNANLEALLTKVEAKALHLNLTDTDEAKRITAMFVSELNVETIRRLTNIVRPKSLCEMTFSDIREKIRQHAAPKQRCVLWEREKLLEMQQRDGESVLNYVARLQEAVKYCEFDKMEAATAEEEVVVMKLVNGLHDADTKRRKLEHIQCRDVFKRRPLTR